MSRRQAAQIFEAGSFLPQHYGVLFNVRISIHHCKLGIYKGSEAAQLVSALTHELRLKLDYREPDSHGFHWSYVHERDDDGGVVTRIAAHVSPNYIEEIFNWARSRFRTRRFTNIPLEAIRMAAPRSALLNARLRFHWSSVRAQMRGLDPAILERSSLGELAPLIEPLRVPKRLRSATGGAECPKIFGTSQTLSPQARKEAALNSMDFLSAWDDRAWSALYIGWELSEHADRVREKERREGKKEKIPPSFLLICSWEATELRMNLKKLEASFPSKPKSRPRLWRGWWLPPNSIPSGLPGNF